MLSLAKASNTLDAPIKFDKPAENVAISMPAKIDNELYSSSIIMLSTETYRLQK